jgi:DNA-binding NtrC family response regulator
MTYNLGKRVSDCYAKLMNTAQPLLICDSREEFRSLLREMLSAQGFFHVIELSSSNEILSFLSSKEEAVFILILRELLSPEILEKLKEKKNFLILAQSDMKETIDLIPQIGLKHFLNFPFSSKSLLERMQQF